MESKVKPTKANRSEAIRTMLEIDLAKEDDDEAYELSQIFWDNENGPESWMMHDGIHWVYLSDGMYISEFGDMKDL